MMRYAKKSEIILIVILLELLFFCGGNYEGKYADNVQSSEEADVFYYSDPSYSQHNTYKYSTKLNENLMYSIVPGPHYPMVAICAFIDDNKALMRRMYGTLPPHDLFNNKILPGPKRRIRQTSPEGDNLCSSKKEIVTPFWANNGSEYRLAIVNFPPFQQAIHIETCRENRSCGGQTNCSCSQDDTWHRLLAYDAKDNCRGIFMEWFKFPSCCKCKCFN